MKRDILEKLVEWKDKPNRKPLILNCDRPVGKTYILEEFATNNDYVEVRRIQKEIIKMYDNDFSKHITGQNELLKTRQYLQLFPKN